MVWKPATVGKQGSPPRRPSGQASLNPSKTRALPHSNPQLPAWEAVGVLKNRSAVDRVGWCGAAGPCRESQATQKAPLVPDTPLHPQYYEMSYGLNIEMHKQVSISFPSPLPQCPVSPKLSIEGPPVGPSVPSKCPRVLKGDPVCSRLKS